MFLIDKKILEEVFLLDLTSVPIDLNEHRKSTENGLCIAYMLC